MQRLWGLNEEIILSEPYCSDSNIRQNSYSGVGGTSQQGKSHKEKIMAGKNEFTHHQADVMGFDQSATAIFKITSITEVISW